MEATLNKKNIGEVKFGEVVPLGQITKSEAHIALENAIMQKAATLKPGEVVPVQGVKLHTFANTVYELRQEGRIGQDIGTRQKNDGSFFLARRKAKKEKTAKAA
jgi:hypothetical protein